MSVKGINIGLCGSHRVGKTTLAEAVSLHTGLPFVRTTTTEIMRECGVDPSQPMEFSTRLRVQRRILEVYEEVFAAQKQEFITDRTPMDLMMYTLADISGTTEVNHRELEDYIERCFAVTNQVFETLFVVQPGIPIVFAEGKASINISFIEHLNSLILGLCHDERTSANVVVFNRSLLGLEERARLVIEKWCWARTGREKEEPVGVR